MTHLSKFYLILSIMVIAAGAMLFGQFRRSQNINTKPSDLPLVAANFTEIPLTEKEKPFGNPGAPLLIVGFFDFNESADQVAAKTLIDFTENNGQTTQFYLKNNPRPKLFGGDRTLVNRALLCAREQQKFPEFLASLVLADKIKTESLVKISSNITLNVVAWQNCLESQATKQTIADDVALANNLNIKNTPTIFLNNKKINLDENTNLSELLNLFVEI